MRNYFSRGWGVDPENPAYGPARFKRPEMNYKQENPVKNEAIQTEDPNSRLHPGDH